MDDGPDTGFGEQRAVNESPRRKTYKTRIILTDYTEYTSIQEAKEAADEWAAEIRSQMLCEAEVADIVEQDG